MSLLKVYSDNVKPGEENITEIINGCIGFYILTPDITDEVEIDFYLQFEFGEVQRNKRVRLEADITLIDTLTLLNIPEELRNVESNKLKLLFLTDISVFLEVWIVLPDKYDGKEDLEKIKNRLEELIVNVNSFDTSKGDYPVSSFLGKTNTSNQKVGIII